MNRKGDWIQIFHILFFILICLVAFLLLVMERSDRSDVTAFLQQDFRDTHAKMILTNLLRQPVDGLDITGDGQPDPATLADKIRANTDGAHTDEIIALFKERVSDEYLFKVIIKQPSRYQDQEIEFVSEELKRGAIDVWVTIEGTLTNRYGEKLPYVSITIPGQGGNIVILFYIDTRDRINSHFAAALEREVI